MPLVINGQIVNELPLDPSSLYSTDFHFKTSSSELCSRQPKSVGPRGLVYVAQREFASTVPHDQNASVLGTDDATTCHVVVLRHCKSGAVALAHLDSPTSAHTAIPDIVHRIRELSSHYFDEGRLELHLVGGFQDEKNCSKELSMSILHACHAHEANIHLVTCCIGEMNTMLVGHRCFPIIYGLGVDVKSGEIFPATFPDKGPDLPLRGARRFTGCHKVFEIYDCARGLLKIGPFNYSPLRGVDLWLQQDDDFILKHLSTSPDVEPSHFVADVRASLTYIRDNPYPSITIFPNNISRWYRKDKQIGNWVPMTNSHFDTQQQHSFKQEYGS